MSCIQFQTDGMRFLDGEMTESEKRVYEKHVQVCPDCRKELKELGRIVELTDELRFRPPDDEFWEGYWESIFRRAERNTGFFLLVIGVIAILIYAIFRAVTSPKFLTYEGISMTVILAGLVVIFISVVRERYHESKNDPYRGVKR
jgi:predicted anti-sigma-YlaC factor YlaD